MEIGKFKKVGNLGKLEMLKLGKILLLGNFGNWTFLDIGKFKKLGNFEVLVNFGKLDISKKMGKF